MCADFKSERRGTENISQCSQSERSCTKNLFREHFAGVVYREHIWTGPLISSEKQIEWGASAMMVNNDTWLRKKKRKKGLYVISSK